MNLLKMNLLKREYAQLIVYLVVLLFGVPVNAQNVFDFNNPTGTYIITDYQNRKITLKLGKATSSDFLITKGPGSITVNGRTIRGTWNRFDTDPYIAFNTYDNVRIVYSLPSGSAKTDQIVISEDGRASYNTSELMKSDGDCIKVKRAPVTSKKVVRNKSVSNNTVKK